MKRDLRTALGVPVWQVCLFHSLLSSQCTLIFLSPSGQWSHAAPPFSLLQMHPLLQTLTTACISNQLFRTVTHVTDTGSRQKGPTGSLDKILVFILHICTGLQMDSIPPASWGHSSIRGFNSVTAITVPVGMSKMSKKRSKVHRAAVLCLLLLQSFYCKWSKTENVLGEHLLCSTESLVCPSFEKGQLWG